MIADIGPDILDTRNVDAHTLAVPADQPYNANCVFLRLLLF